MTLRLVASAIIGDIERFARWYFIDGTKRVVRACAHRLGQVERTFGIRANLQHFTEPLYRDYTPIAYLFAVPWRSVLIVVGAMAAIAVIAVHLAFLIFWLVLPLLISLRLYHGKFI